MAKQVWLAEDGLQYDTEDQAKAADRLLKAEREAEESVAEYVRRKGPPGADPAPLDDSFITSGEAKRLAGGICDMTLWRWKKVGIIPPPKKIRTRNYWRRSEFLRALEIAMRHKLGMLPPEQENDGNQKEAGK